MGHIEEYFANYDGLSADEFVNRYMRSSEQECDRLRKTISLIPPDVESVLDIGAGYGLLLEEIEKRRKIRGVGIEITDAKIEYGRRLGVDMRKGDASCLDFPDKSFDMVVSCEVIEHLPFGTFETALSELTRVARKYVLISVPFNEHRVFVQCPYCGSTVHPYYHMRSFSVSTMHSLLEGVDLMDFVMVGSTRVDLLQKWMPIRRGLAWPRFMVCACCGYKRGQDAEGNKAARCEDPSRRSPRWSGMLKVIAKSIVSMTAWSKPKWIVARYSITGESRPFND